MSFAEIKKAINDNLSKPLNVLIKEYLENTTYGLSALKTAVNTVNTTANTINTTANTINSNLTGGKSPVVKSVQRGSITETIGASPPSDISITISSVNANKCLVILDNREIMASLNTFNTVVSSLTSTTLTVKPGYYYDATQSVYKYRGLPCYWQVIEFY